MSLIASLAIRNEKFDQKTKHEPGADQDGSAARKLDVVAALAWG
jgi:hypothetical protein